MTRSEKMTLQDAMDMLGVTTQAEMARALGVHRQHVHVWKNGIPVLRQYQIRELARTRDAASSLGE